MTEKEQQQKADEDRAKFLEGKKAFEEIMVWVRFKFGIAIFLWLIVCIIVPPLGIVTLIAWILLRW